MIHDAFKHLTIGLLTLFIATSSYAQLIPLKLGDALEERPFHESSTGQVAIYAGQEFGFDGSVDTWTFFSSGPPGTYVNPLLFERVNGTDFILRGMGATRPIFHTGINSFRYDPEAREPFVRPNYTFGFTDRSAYVPENPGPLEIVTSSRFPGAIDFGYTNAPGWYFTSNEVFELVPGQIYRVNGTASANVVPLQEKDPTGYRVYSARMSGLGILPAVQVTISPSFELCWKSFTTRQYRVEWATDPAAEWHDMGVLIPGNGTTNCLSDPGKTEQQRFYRVLSLP